MSGKHPLVQAVEQSQLRTDLPAFAPGDTVVVQVKVVLECAFNMDCTSKQRSAKKNNMYILLGVTSEASGKYFSKASPSERLGAAIGTSRKMLPRYGWSTDAISSVFS